MEKISVYSPKDGRIQRVVGPVSQSRACFSWNLLGGHSGWQEPLESILQISSEKVLYFEFRYRFDPWWHDNKTPSEMCDEFNCVRRMWRNKKSVPWSVSHFPKVPPCSIIASYFQPSQRHDPGKDQPKRKFYNRHCTTLRQFFWKNQNILEDPKLYFKAVLKVPKEIKSMIPLAG
jgi:hypothetical protein